MKILKEKQEWSCKETCGECNSILLIEEDDIIYNLEEAMAVGGRWVYGFQCPICKQKRFWDLGSLNHVPRMVLRKAEKKALSI